MILTELEGDGVVGALLFAPADSNYARIALRFGVIGPRVITIEAPYDGGEEGGGGEGGVGSVDAD